MKLSMYNIFSTYSSALELTMDKGTEFTESMIQLLLKKKIVGYELHCPINNYDGASVEIYHSTSIGEVLNPTDPSNIQSVSDGDCPIEYDSFNPGIKVGDNEWIFSGDVCEVKYLLPVKDEEDFTGTLFYLETLGLFTISDKPNEHEIQYSEHMTGVDIKKIGSIYEEEK